MTVRHDASLFQETVVSIPAAQQHHTLLQTPDGRFLARERGDLCVLDVVDDRAIWTRQEPRFTHVSSGDDLIYEERDGALLVRARKSQSDNADEHTPREIVVTPCHGPERLPSEYLAFFRENGWVCLTSILAPEVVEELERVGGTDRYENVDVDRTLNPIVQTSAIARTAAEPVSLWLIRQYMQMEEIRLAHAPGLAVLMPDDGERAVQGWHADYPYHWGVPAQGRVPTSSGQTVLGVQRNVCVSPFTKVGGATAFKLGSHARDCAPPSHWGLASDHYKPGWRGEHGLPYTGPEAEIIEAPGGSIILYDARTWHRAGVNRTEKKRSALLQAMTPMYVLPKNDTSAAYKALVSSDVYAELTEREKTEIQQLMVHTFIGPGGQYAIAPDRVLTGRVKDRKQQTGGY